MVQVWFCFKFSLVLGLPSIPSALESFEEMSVSVILSMASSASPPQFLQPQIRPQKQFLKWLMGPTRDIWGSTQPQLSVSTFKVVSILLDSPQRLTYWANWPEEESQEEVLRVSLAYSKALRSCVPEILQLSSWTCRRMAMCVSWSTRSAAIFYVVLFIFPTFSALTNWFPKGPPSSPLYEMGVPLWNPPYPLLRGILSTHTGQLRTNVPLAFLHQSMAILSVLRIRQTPCNRNHPGLFLSHPIIPYSVHQQTLVA